QPFRRRIDRRHCPLGGLVVPAERAPLGMDHLEARRTAADLAEAAQPHAAREALLLPGVEVEEAQHERAGAVRDTAQQRPAPPKHDLRQLDRALDEHLLARAKAAERTHLRAVLVALGQEQERVADALDAEPLQLPGQRRADAVQGRDGPLQHVLPRAPRRLRSDPAAHRARPGRRLAARTLDRRHPGSMRIASISTAASFGSCATPIAARAGYGSSKYCAMISLTSGKWARSVR